MSLPTYDQSTATSSASPADSTANNSRKLTLPATFNVGGVQRQPFVAIQDASAHLRILGAFQRLREIKVCQTSQQEKVDNLPKLNADVVGSFSGDTINVPPEVIWAVYLQQAVIRFELWYNKILMTGSGKLSLNEYPPLDVHMIWHSFLLNPWSYHEDSLLRFPRLSVLNGMDCNDIASYIDPDTFEYTAPPEAVKNWTSTTQTPFEAEVPLPSDVHTFTCPKCSLEHTAPYINQNQSGWAQSFSFPCSCGLEITKSSFAFLRLCTTVREYLVYSAGKTASTNGIPYSACLTGTTMSNVGVPEAYKAERVNKQWITPFEARFSAQSTPREIATGLDWKWEEIEKLFTIGMLGKPLSTPKMVIRLLSAYKHAYFASMDLAGAVNRQFGFIQTLDSLGWLSPHRFDSDQTVLVLAIARYHAFLDLMSARGPSSSLLVPTIDIDLIFHTHQLKDSTYRETTHETIGRIPNHDDKIEENKLSNSFEVTSKAWKERFGVPYSTCGCPLSEEEQGLGSKMKERFKLSSSKSTSSAPAPKDSLIHLSTISQLPSSHPSEHNSVRVLDSVSEAERAKRLASLSKTIAREEKLVRTGKADRWTIARKESRDKGHEMAFQGSNKAKVKEYWGVNTPLLIGSAYGLGLAGCGFVVSGTEGLESGSNLAPMMTTGTWTVGPIGAGCGAVG